MCKNMDSRENYVLKIGICDDNIDCITTIAKSIESEIIEQKLNAEIVYITDSQKKIFDAIYNKEIDILFLDIDFKNKGKNGIDFANDLREVNREFFLVFLTSHQRYMHVSFCVKVFDYLVKPSNKYVIQDLISRLKSEFQNNKSLFLTLNKWISVRIDDILFLEKLRNKTRIVTCYDEYTTTKTLDNLLNELPNSFLKCHRSYILNATKVKILDRKSQYAYFNKKIKCPINSYFELN